MSEIPELKIFLSSPGDVAEERAHAEGVFRRIASEFADIVCLRLIIWEHEPLYAHSGFQQQIERPSQCDLVVSIIWSRLGTRLPSDFAPAGEVAAPTGTEFELNDALASFARIGKPNLLIYRKIPGPQIGLGSQDFAERSSQFARLDDFCRHAFYDADGAVIVAHSTFTSITEFDRRLEEHVRRWISRDTHSSPSGSFQPAWKGKSPFRGLQPFEAEHQAVYFGRSEAMGDLTRRIRDTEASVVQGQAASRLLVVQGMSGSGKTSLFKAGLLPLLDLRPVEGIAHWVSVVIRPSDSDSASRELGALAVLAGVVSERVPSITRLGHSVSMLAEMLNQRPMEARAALETCLAAEAERLGMGPHQIRLMIYVDQLEEAFAVPDAAAHGDVLMAAIGALANSRSIWVAASLRSDFAHRLEAYPELVEGLALNPSYVLIPPRSDELAEMIREPARAAGLLWEHQDGIPLDQALLRDATGNPEVLPLLEYTLSQLYEKREGRLLRWSDYGGGLKGALVAAAEEVIGGSPEDSTVEFRDVMRELVGVGVDGTASRRYAPLRRFPVNGETRKLLDRLIARRLCVATDDGRGDGPVVCLAHEALILSWPRAQRWLQQEYSLLRIRDELALDAAIWAGHKRADGWLGTAPEKIATIRQMDKAGLLSPGLVSDYAVGSRRKAARLTFIKRAAVTLIGLLSVVAGCMWWVAHQQRNVARSEAESAARTIQFMVDLFQEADPAQNRGQLVTVQQFLKNGADELESNQGTNPLTNEPQVRADMLTAMGRAYTGLGLYPPAETLLQQARSVVEAVPVPADSRVRSLTALGVTYYLAGEYEKARKPLQDAVAIARRSLDPANILRSQALTGLADELAQLGDSKTAVELCKEALAADQKRGQQDVAVTANTLDSLAGAYAAGGGFAEAEAPYRQSEQLYEHLYGANHARVAQELNNLAANLYEEGKYGEARNDYYLALPIYRKVYGDSHPAVASILNNIARSALMAGNIEEAEPMFRQALKMTQDFDTENHDDLVPVLNSLAMIDAYRGRLDPAMSEIEKAEAIARIPGHGDLLDQILMTKAGIELAEGQAMIASLALVEAKTKLVTAHPDAKLEAWRYAVWDVLESGVMAANDDVAGAERTLDAARAVLIDRFGPKGFYSVMAERQSQLLKSRHLGNKTS